MFRCPVTGYLEATVLISFRRSRARPRAGGGVILALTAAVSIRVPTPRARGDKSSRNRTCKKQEALRSRTQGVVIPASVLPKVLGATLDEPYRERDWFPIPCSSVIPASI
jgi:hypothetical protein